MKKIAILISIIVLISCNDKKETKEVLNKSEEAIITNFDWLLGEWKRTNEEEGKRTYENWSKAGENYTGLGFTMQNKDTISSEKMQLLFTANSWKLIVVSLGKGSDTSPTTFKMIASDKQSFTFENKKIDFPNTIHYQKDGAKLKAFISNEQMKIPFDFERYITR